MLKHRCRVLSKHERITGVPDFVKNGPCSEEREPKYPKVASIADLPQSLWENVMYFGRPAELCLYFLKQTVALITAPFSFAKNTSDNWMTSVPFSDDEQTSSQIRAKFENANRKIAAYNFWSHWSVSACGILSRIWIKIWCVIGNRMSKVYPNLYAPATNFWIKNIWVGSEWPATLIAYHR